MGRRLSYRRWTKDEEKFLRENYTKLSLREIANRLDRSLVSVECKVYRMGLSGARRAIEKSLMKISSKKRVVSYPKHLREIILEGVRRGLI